MRAAVLPVLLLAVVAVSLMGTGLTTVNGTAEEGGPAVRWTDRVWKEAYSRRFPGCVSTVLWPATERPVAVVVRDRRGRVSRLGLRDAVRRADQGRLTGVTTLGACRDRAGPGHIAAGDQGPARAGPNVLGPDGPAS